MTDAVKPITEAELHYLLLRSPADIAADFRMRGFMAKEPETDPLLIEAREICARVCEGWRDIPVERGQQYREGSHDDEADVAYALAALKRGMEMRPPLTREMVREAVECLSYETLECGSRDVIADLLHLALTKEQS